MMFPREDPEDRGEEPIRVKRSERAIFQTLNMRAAEIRTLLTWPCLPDGRTRRQSCADAADVLVLRLGTAERISALVEMSHLSHGSSAIMPTVCIIDVVCG